MGAAKIKAPDTLFLPRQAKWIKDKSRLKIAEKPRQVGFTWCTAYADTIACGMINNRYDFWITSTDELQAKLYVEDCKNWANFVKLAARANGQKLLLDESGKKVKAQALDFANERTLYSLSSNFNAQAGKRGPRRADEFAINKNNRMLYDIMKPGITWDGNIWIWSTHRGSQNFFNVLINEIKHGGNPKGFSLHSMTLEDMLNEGLLDKLQSKWQPDDPRQDWDETDYFNATRAECSSEEAFNQEYMCIPSDDATAFISYDLLDACSYDITEPWEAAFNPESVYYMGVDVARTTDYTIFWILELTSDIRCTRRIIEMKNTPFSDQEAALYSYLEKPCIRRCCIDASGIGRQFAERARQRFGNKVEEVTFTNNVKEDLAMTLLQCMQDRRFRMPSDRKLSEDFRNIRKETTSSNNVRFVGERTLDGHSDRFWAAALALHAAKSPSCTYDPVPVTVYGNNEPKSYDDYALPNNSNLIIRPF